MKKFSRAEEWCSGVMVGLLQCASLLSDENLVSAMKRTATAIKSRVGEDKAALLITNALVAWQCDRDSISTQADRMMRLCVNKAKEASGR